MYVVLVITTSAILTGISARPVADYSNIYTSFATEYALDFYPTTVYQPAVDRNLKEKIDVKELIETLQNRPRWYKTPVPIAEITRSTNAIGSLYKSKYDNVDNSSENLVPELAILDTAYRRVSDHLESVHKAIQKNYDVMLKLHILKGMLMEESIRSKRSRPWIEYITKYKSVNERYD